MQCFSPRARPTLLPRLGSITSRGEQANPNLALSLSARAQAQIDYLQSGEPSRVFTEFTYQTLESWSRARRVIAKAEHLAKRGESALRGHLPVRRGP
jgi:hypothetical protein